MHSIALQVPKADLTRHGSTPTNASSPDSVVGIWASASRQAATVREPWSGYVHEAGEWMQVSRLGNPLFNEVLVGMGFKDLWNSLPPYADKRFVGGVQHPELAALLPVLYPGVFPNLAKLTAARADLVAILLTGVPAGLIPGFQNFTGNTLADMLRLNMAIPPATNPSTLRAARRRPGRIPERAPGSDDVVAIELRAIAGATYPLVDAGYTPDAAAAEVTDGLTPASVAVATSPRSRISGSHRVAIRPPRLGTV